MNVQNFREYCLSLKGSHNKLAFKKSNSEYDKDILVFSVADKWFAFANIEVFDFCNLKCDPEESLDLQDKYEGIVPAYHMNKKHWISVYFNKDVPDTKIKELIKKSYELVYGALPKKLQDEITDGNEK
jgi:predicted DNA-binding protein (MmcQ/YjbR family)